MKERLKKGGRNQNCDHDRNPPLGSFSSSPQVPFLQEALPDVSLESPSVILSPAYLDCEPQEGRDRAVCHCHDPSITGTILAMWSVLNKSLLSG